MSEGRSIRLPGEVSLGHQWTPNDCADATHAQLNGSSHVQIVQFGGLTIRERLAASALTAAPVCCANDGTADDLADAALAIADAILARTRPKPPAPNGIELVT